MPPCDEVEAPAAAPVFGGFALSQARRFPIESQSRALARLAHREIEIFQAQPAYRERTGARHGLPSWPVGVND